MPLARFAPLQRGTSRGGFREVPVDLNRGEAPRWGEPPSAGLQHELLKGVLYLRMGNRVKLKELPCQPQWNNPPTAD
jgi:hypothetical protein